MAAPDGLVGQALDGRYVVERRIGSGGMGQVYLGRQLASSGHIERPVAIKLLSTEGTLEQDLLARFENEASIVSKLRHPNTLVFVDFGRTAQGAPYFVTEFLPGEPLSHRISRGPLSVAETLQIALQVCASLEEAHALGVVHRDIKPGNIFLTRVGDQELVKVLDFGIAKATQGALIAGAEKGVTAPGTVIGTPRYASPEQGRGQPVSPQTDLYALGVVAYECLTGKTPFEGTAVQLLKKHAVDPPPKMSERAPSSSFDPRVESLIMRLLAKLPEQRPPGAGPLRQEIDGLLRQLDAKSATVEQRPPTPPKKSGRWIPAIIALAVVALLGAAGMIVRHERSGPVERERSSVPKGMIEVAGADLLMGSKPEEVNEAFEWCRAMAGSECRKDIYEREMPAHDVHVDSFFMDETEATNEAFAAWLAKKTDLSIGDREARDKVGLVARVGGDRSGLEIDADLKRIVVRSGWAHKPMVMVTWRGAQSFCEAQGARLPTEAEWELAARGRERRRFPWGDSAPRCDQAAFGRGEGMPCHAKGEAPDDVGGTGIDRTPLGVRGLGGNVAEWTADRFEPSYGTADGASSSRERTVRGGFFDMWADACRGAGRSRWKEDEGAHNIGFRCVRSATEKRTEGR
jgi:serine/threonine protein kinase